DEQVAPARPRRQRVGRSGISGIDDSPPAALDGICHALRRVRYRMARQTNAIAKLEDVVRHDFTNGHGKPGRRHPLTVRRGEPAEQWYGAGRPDEIDGRGPAWQTTVLPGENQRGQIAVMIDV